jgi:2-(1,2-epoxy-1,2-dihydrophenyl)acetyl-CoA isomerase
MPATAASANPIWSFAMTAVVAVSRDGPLVQLLLDRPRSFNALNPALLEALTAQLGELAVDQSVRAIVISGTGRAFCAGGDLRWVAEQPAGPGAAFRLLASRFHQAILEIRGMPKPVIAAVNGVAAGGGFSLALACDFRVLARSAQLRQAYTSSGLSIDGGGTHTLPRLVGLARALEIAAFDRPIGAEQALAWGLATQVVDDGQALAASLDLARDLSARSLQAFACSKALLTESLQTPLETQLERERRALAACGDHPDGQEGIRAFLEKRPPTFI